MHGNMRSTYKILKGNPQGKKNFEDLGGDRS
jgi:hypothetical protein